MPRMRGVAPSYSATLVMRARPLKTSSSVHQVEGGKVSGEKMEAGTAARGPWAAAALTAAAADARLERDASPVPVPAPAPAPDDDDDDDDDDGAWTTACEVPEGADAVAFGCAPAPADDAAAGKASWLT